MRPRIVAVAVLAAAAAAAVSHAEPDRRSQAAPAAHRSIQRLVFAGPALAGGSIVWGERYRDGSLAVIRQPLGGRPRVLHVISAPTGEDRERHFLGLPGALSASSVWIAYGLDDATVTSHGDSVSSEAAARAFASRHGAPFRDALANCSAGAYIATASAGEAVAIGQSSADCDGQSGTRVWLVEGRAPAPRLIYASPDPHLGLRQVQLAGRWVAWSEGGTGAGDTRITVADRRTGEVAARLRPEDFAGGHAFSAFDIDADGTLVALSGRQPRCYYVCVSWRRLNGRRSHTISRRALDQRVAIAAGRIAYVTQRRLHAHRLILARLDGRVLRRFGRFGRSRRPVGDIALTPHRIAWAVLHSDGELVPGAQGSVHTATLP